MNIGVCDFSRLAVTDWRLRRWRYRMPPLLFSTNKIQVLILGFPRTQIFPRGNQWKAISGAGKQTFSPCRNESRKVGGGLLSRNTTQTSQACFPHNTTVSPSVRLSIRLRNAAPRDIFPDSPRQKLDERRPLCGAGRQTQRE